MYQNLAVATAEICQGRMAPGEGEQLDTCVLPDPQRLQFSLFFFFFARVQPKASRSPILNFGSRTEMPLPDTQIQRLGS